jgi:5-methyltetrahydropteroyltriglutamate--homocysteine methyltransferase
VHLIVVETYLTGLFPRSEQLVEATRAAVRGKISPADLEAAFRSDLAALARLQSDAGLSFLVDGQLNWQDLFRPFSELFAGIQLGGLTRWFDNNTFYRKPIIAGKTKFSNVNIEAYFRSSLLPASTPKKAILPGPFTFAVMSENGVYESLADLVDDIAHELRQTVEVLCRAGYGYFQFSEPCLGVSSRTKSELEIAKHAFEVCAKPVSAKTSLQTYFGDAGPVVHALLDFPVDCLGLDFYATSLDSLPEYSFEKELGCGCIDGRNSLLESPADVAKFIKKVREKVEPRGMSICTNCDLEFLPYPVAEKKVRALSETKKMLA